MARYAPDQQFREALPQSFGQLSTVRGRREDADEALGLVDGPLKRLWREHSTPSDLDDEPREMTITVEGTTRIRDAVDRVGAGGRAPVRILLGSAIVGDMLPDDLGRVRVD